MHFTMKLLNIKSFLCNVNTIVLIAEWIISDLQISVFVWCNYSGFINIQNYIDH